tara:strand:+ start:115 stop:273 length:159 start_codon:yes stop_codon:yes gene_type:complete
MCSLSPRSFCRYGCNGVKSELQDEGYVLFFQAYPKSDLKIIANQFDAFWDQR